jgi:hypothetical protein
MRELRCTCRVVTRWSRDGVPVGRARDHNCPCHGDSVTSKAERDAFHAQTEDVSCEPIGPGKVRVTVTVDGVEIASVETTGGTFGRYR